MLSLARSHKLAPRKRHVLPPGFWAKVDCSGGEGACWIWGRGKNTNGYGVFNRGGKRYYAHRAVLQFVTQREGEDLFATHGPCHTKNCVNPAHLSWQGAHGNMADKVRDGTHVRGERHGQNKLTEEQVHAIRADARSQSHIAAAYRVARTTVRDIKTRRKWGWLD